MAVPSLFSISTTYLPPLSLLQLSQRLTRISESEHIAGPVLLAVDSVVEHERWCRARDRLRAQLAQRQPPVATANGAAHPTHASNAAVASQLQHLLQALGLDEWTGQALESASLATMLQLGHAVSAKVAPLHTAGAVASSREIDPPFAPLRSGWWLGG